MQVKQTKSENPIIKSLIIPEINIHSRKLLTKQVNIIRFHTGEAKNVINGLLKITSAQFWIFCPLPCQ